MHETAMSLREELNQALKTAMKAREERALSTIRLILTAIKDRDIAARPKGNLEGISDQDILGVLQTMVRQRQEAIKLYEQGGRLELAQKEQDEIAIIGRFMPKQLGDDEARDAIKAIVAEIGANSIKDIGRTMAVLRERYAGRLDFAKAGATLKELLGAA
jgi:uncharacterized protein YqeY